MAVMLQSGSVEVTNMTPIERIYTVAEAAEILRVSEAVVRSLIRGKQLGAVKVGRDYRLTESDIEAYLSTYHTIKGSGDVSGTEEG